MKDFSTKCKHFSKCSGCNVKNFLKPPVLEDFYSYFKKSKTFFYANGFYGTRFKAKLAVRGKMGKIKIGLFKENSHEVFDIPKCSLHHPSINKGVFLLKKFLKIFKITSYDEKTKKGAISYIQLFVCRKTKKVQLTLVLNDESKKDLLKKMARKLFFKSKIWHSIFLNLKKEDSNYIFGNEFIHLHGKNFLFQKIKNANMAFHPACFSQSNLLLFEKMIFEIDKNIPTRGKILELYAGNGSIGLNLLNKERSLTLIENNVFAKISFEKSKKFFHKNVKYLFLDVKKALPLIEEFNTIIVDPPRKGLDGEVLKKLSQKKCGKLLYISCSFKTLKRDCDHLKQNGWRVLKASSYLFFPGTNQIETLTILEKSG
jgi:23S rRNA (uracil-5-)-methyltransferase RumA